ncbi:hypothetical protein K439DRAFT_1142186 [Ramaria rubella]|nr:hypothetical protein K439DRAFT_1142186 [Ramaria rubella]
MLSTLLSSFIIQAEASKEDEKEQKNPGVSEAGEGDDNKEEGGAAEGGTAEQEEEEPEDVRVFRFNLALEWTFFLSFRMVPLPSDWKGFSRCQTLTVLSSSIRHCERSAATLLSALVSRSTSNIAKRKFKLERGSKARIALRRCDMMHCADNCVAPTLFSKLR